MLQVLRCRLRVGTLRVGSSLVLLTLGAPAAAADRYVATTGNDAGDCASEQAPCATIAYGISAMSGGDTLIIADGTYTDPVVDMPSGSADAYTTIRAANDWGVLIDGSDWPDAFRFGIEVQEKHHVTVRGVRVRMSHDTVNNLPIIVLNSDHVKLQRCSASHGPATGNAANIDIGPGASYVLIEECYAFGGSRYQFIIYESDHVIVRRSVARNDYWDDGLQCAGFVNYDSLNTAWQNNIVLDSDTAHCAGKLYGGFWNENKVEWAPDTSETLTGNIVLNVQAFYAGDLDWGVSGVRTLRDMVIWGSSGGYHGDQGPGVTATIHARNMTIGALNGQYDGPNGSPASGTAFSVYGNLDNSLTNSIIANCESIGVADYTVSDHNVFAGNGKNFGGAHQAVPGPNDRCAENGSAIDPFTNGLRYLPRLEASSPLLTAGDDGGRVGAQILNRIGVTGSLQDDPGWDTVTADALWPFPNEDQIKSDMASYDGPGAPGARGFATGTSLDGSPQTLTKYVWEYLGNPIPPEVYNGTSAAGAGGAGSGTGGGSGTAGSGTAGSGAGASGGANSLRPDDEVEDGCGCRASSRTGGASAGLLAAAALLACARARTPRSLRLRSRQAVPETGVRRPRRPLA